MNIVGTAVLSPDDQRAVRDPRYCLGRPTGAAWVSPGSRLGRHSPRYTTCSHSTPTYSSATPQPGRDGEPSTVRPWSPTGPWPRIGTEVAHHQHWPSGADTRALGAGDLPAARALAARLGLVPRRELLQLHRGLEELPALPSHDDIELRTYAGPADDAEDPAREQRCFRLAPRAGWVDRRTDRRADRRGLVRPCRAVSGLRSQCRWRRRCSSSGSTGPRVSTTSSWVRSPSSASTRPPRAWPRPPAHPRRAALPRAAGLHGDAVRRRRQHRGAGDLSEPRFCALPRRRGLRSGRRCC